MAKSDNNINLNKLDRIVSDGFKRNDQRFDKIEQILATMADTLVAVQTELREFREIVFTNHEQRLKKLEKVAKT